MDRMLVPAKSHEGKSLHINLMTVTCITPDPYQKGWKVSFNVSANDGNMAFIVINDESYKHILENFSNEEVTV